MRRDVVLREVVLRAIVLRREVVLREAVLRREICSVRNWSAPNPEGAAATFPTRIENERHTDGFPRFKTDDRN